MITTADARTAVGLGTDTSRDRDLARLILEATAALGRELGRYLGTPLLRSEVKCGGHPPGHREVFLDYDPTVSASRPMTVSTRATIFATFAELAAEKWALDGRTVVALGNFPPGRGTVLVEYWTGYTVGQGPGELSDLVRQLVVLRWAARGAGTDVVLKSETLGDYSYTRGDVEALAGWEGVVSRWRRRLV